MLDSRWPWRRLLARVLGAALGRPRLHRDVTSASAGVAMICTVLAPLHAALPKIWRT
jgi:hypothetical protein